MPVDDASELDTLWQQADGDEAAFEAVYRRTSDELRAWIAFRCYRLEMVDECLQRTYITAYRHRQRYRPGASLTAWLKGIARNEIGKFLREGRRVIASRQVPLECVLAADDAGVDAGDDDSAVLERLRQCLGRLGERTRDLVWRRYAEGASVQGLAAEQRRQAGAVSVALHRARRALLDCLAPEGG